MKDLIPLLADAEWTYEQEKRFSEDLDRKLGLDIAAVEVKIANSIEKKNWAGFSPQVFQTPYTELRRILALSDLASINIIIDLGCAYARLGLVVGKYFSGVMYIGIELEPLRVDLAKKYLAEYSNVSLVCLDLAKSQGLPLGDCYFIYDFGSREDIEIVLNKLKELAKVQSFFVVARGGESRQLIDKQHLWLSAVEKPCHYKYFSIYKNQVDKVGNTE